MRSITVHSPRHLWLAEKIEESVPYEAEVQDDKFGDVEKVGLQNNKEKVARKQKRGIYAVRRSRHDALVEDNFLNKDVRPAKRICREGKENVSQNEGQESESKTKKIFKNILPDIRLAFLHAIKDKGRRQRQEEERRIDAGPGKAAPGKTKEMWQNYKAWTPAQDRPLTATWVFSERKPFRNPHLNNREENKEL